MDNVSSSNFQFLNNELSVLELLHHMVHQGLTSHSTHYRSFRRRFYGSDNPTNSVITPKDNG